MPKKKTTFGISFPDPRLLEMAKLKADQLGLSLSAYINQLVRRDLNLPNVFGLKLLPPEQIEAVAEEQAPYDATPRDPAGDALSTRAERPAPPPTAPSPKQPAPAKGKG